MKTANDMIQEKGGDILCVTEGTLVLDALKQMNARKVGAIMVTRDGKPVGIWMPEWMIDTQGRKTS
jgi:predicted transcriptional regulator